jgi:hypothetical protein
MKMKNKLVLVFMAIVLSISSFIISNIDNDQLLSNLSLNQVMACTMLASEGPNGTTLWCNCSLPIHCASVYNIELGYWEFIDGVLTQY